MNSRYWKPSMWRMRPLSERPNTTMNSVEEMTGASTVCVHSFETRSVSRRASHTKPAVPVTGIRLGGADQLPEVRELAWPAEVPALTEVGTHRAQLVRLVLGLDSFRHDVHPERAGEHDDCADAGRVLAVAADVGDEGAVDLEHVDLGHLAQVPKGREA